MTDHFIKAKVLETVGNQLKISSRQSVLYDTYPPTTFAHKAYQANYGIIHYRYIVEEHFIHSFKDLSYNLYSTLDRSLGLGA
jgi:hypothetical protein